MNILFAIGEPFPQGMASTNRILTYCRGFVEAGAKVKVVIIRPTEKQELGVRNHLSAGNYEGTLYVYAAGSPIRSESFLVRRWQDAWGLMNSCRILWQEARRNRPDAVIMVSAAWPKQILPFWIITRLTGIKLLQERSEYPLRILAMKRFPWSLYRAFYLGLTFKAFDGMLIMTNALVDFLVPLMRSTAAHKLVPMTVEPDRFIDVKAPRPLSDPYVAYCGAPQGNKDGVPILVEAFALIATRFPQHKLVIIGDADDPGVLEGLRRQGDELGLGQRLVLTGRVARDDMPAWLCHADALALARPSSLQAQGGFPTKLGEYLATGKPVVVTAVGEIPEYLKDGENAFVAPPDSPSLFAEKLAQALSDESLASKVGANGRALALQKFNYRVQAEETLAFIRTLNRHDARPARWKR